LATSANYGNISAYFRVTSKHFEAALTYMSMQACRISIYNRNYQLIANHAKPHPLPLPKELQVGSKYIMASSVYVAFCGSR